MEHEMKVRWNVKEHKMEYKIKHNMEHNICLKNEKVLKQHLT